IVNVGRIASSCYLDPATQSALGCSVDFANPPTGNLTPVRFSMTSSGLNYDQFQNGQWVTTISFAGIASFVWCDDTAMANKTCGLDTLPNGKISQVYSASVAGGVPPSRFFRFRLTVNIDRQGASPQPVQSSFHLRNPASNGIQYVWGSWQ